MHKLCKKIEKKRIMVGWLSDNFDIFYIQIKSPKFTKHLLNIKGIFKSKSKSFAFQHFY